VILASAFSCGRSPSTPRAFDPVLNLARTVATAVSWVAQMYAWGLEQSGLQRPNILVTQQRSRLKDRTADGHFRPTEQPKANGPRQSPFLPNLYRKDDCR
jgi:hypothetical protein